MGCKGDGDTHGALSVWFIEHVRGLGASIKGFKSMIFLNDELIHRLMSAKMNNLWRFDLYENHFATIIDPDDKGWSPFYWGSLGTRLQCHCTQGMERMGTIKEWHGQMSHEGSGQPGQGAFRRGASHRPDVNVTMWASRRSVLSHQDKTTNNEAENRGKCIYKTLLVANTWDAIWLVARQPGRDTKHHNVTPDTELTAHCNYCE